MIYGPVVYWLGHVTFTDEKADRNRSGLPYRNDMDILVALLTSRDAIKLTKCIESVLPQTSYVVVLCKPLDFSYGEQAKKVACAYKLEF